MRLHDLMTRAVVSLEESDPLELADRYLELGQIRHLPVTRRGKLVGLVTQRDLLRHCQRRSVQTGAPLTARDVMTKQVMTLPPNASVREAIRLMLSNKFGCIPVTEGDGRLLGIVTESDLLRFADARIEELERRELAAEYDA
jgi:CBS domain-containing protein